MGEAERLEGWGPRRRSQERRDSLIEAAAAVVDRVGLDHLTTTLVAKEAGASIGTIYRYFPDRIGVIDGLRERSSAILHERLHDALSRPVDGWDAAIDAVLDVIVGAYRAVPGFRAVTVRDWLGDEGSAVLACVDRLARASVAHLPSTRREAVTSARLEGAVRILDALARSAFEASADGDAELLALARRHALDEIGLGMGVTQPDPARGGARRWRLLR